MNCRACNSTELVFVESHADAAAAGGFVRSWQCTDCGEINHDIPPEDADARRDNKMTNEAESR